MWKIFLLTILLATSAYAGPSPLAGRITAITVKFHIDNWKVYILEEQGWEQIGKKYNFLGATDQAATFPKDRITLIRKARTESIGDRDLLNLLSHEAGHVLCNCVDEIRAESFAENLRTHH